MLQNGNNYLGNPNLKKANVSVEWTEEQVQNIQSAWITLCTLSKTTYELFLLMRD